MTKIFITGASGNVGKAILVALNELATPVEIIVGTRQGKPLSSINFIKNITSRTFDFLDRSTFANSFQDIDIMFLLRPPQIEDVSKTFKPLIDEAKNARIKHIVFLSVQGVEKSTIIPHHKIEKLIVESGISYTFLRPAYFMQNFITTLRSDLFNKSRIFLPAGKSRFTLVDVRDIGKVAASILVSPQNHFNKSYELTSNDLLSFLEMANELTKTLGRKIEYISPNLFRFILAKRKEGVPITLIMVMIMLHYLPRFQQEPKRTNCIKYLTSKDPISFHDFCTTINLTNDK